MKTVLLMGQSNIAGRGKLGEVPEIINEKIFMQRDNGWVVMKEPIHKNSVSDGIGPGASFAQKFVEKYDEYIGLIPCAVGGTSILQWQPESEIYKNTIKMANSIRKEDEIVGIIWQLGETDSTSEEIAKNYEEKFMNMIASLKNDLNLDNIIVVIGELPEFYYGNMERKYARLITKIINDIVNKNYNYNVVSSKGLETNGDGLHYNSVSYRILGERFFEAFDELFSK